MKFFVMLMMAAVFIFSSQVRANTIDLQKNQSVTIGSTTVTCLKTPEQGACNSYGCSRCGTCTIYGCSNSSACNMYGCSEHGVCTIYGCP